MTGVSNGQPLPLNQIGCCSAGRAHRLPLRLLRLLAAVSSLLHLPHDIGWKIRLPLDLEGVLRNVEKQGDDLPDHSLDLVEAAGLRVAALHVIAIGVSDLDSPPVAATNAARDVGLGHVLIAPIGLMTSF